MYISTKVTAVTIVQALRTDDLVSERLYYDRAKLSTIVYTIVADGALNKGAPFRTRVTDCSTMMADHYLRRPLSTTAVSDARTGQQQQLLI